MPTQFTPELGFEKPDFNDLNWHLPLNSRVDLLEEAIGGYITVDVVAGDVTLVMTDGVSSDGRHALVDFTGAPTAALTATLPTNQKFWLLRNSSGKLITVKTLAGAGISLFPAKRALVYCDGTDILMIFQINDTTPELIKLSLTDKAFKEHWDLFDEELWEEYLTDPVATAVKTADSVSNLSAYGGSYLRVTGKKGYRTRFNIPFNPDALYKISFRVRQKTDPAAGTKRIHAGFIGYAADGTTIVDRLGFASDASVNQFMFAAASEVLTASNDYTYFVGYVKGTVASAIIATRKHAGDPGKVHDSVRYVRPAFEVNEDNADGVVDVDAVEVEVIEPEGTRAEREILTFSDDEDKTINVFSGDIIYSGTALTADRVYTLANDFKKGQRRRFVNETTAFFMEIKANDGSSIAHIHAGMRIELEALKDSPAVEADWLIVYVTQVALRLHKVASQSLGTSEAKITWSSGDVEFDTNNGMDFTNERYVVLIPGKYFFRSGYAGTSPNSARYEVSLKVSGILVGVSRRIVAGPFVVFDTHWQWSVDIGFGGLVEVFGKITDSGASGNNFELDGFRIGD